MTILYFYLQHHFSALFLSSSALIFLFLLLILPVSKIIHLLITSSVLQIISLKSYFSLLLFAFLVQQIIHLAITHHCLPNHKTPSIILRHSPSSIMDMTKRFPNITTILSNTSPGALNPSLSSSPFFTEITKVFAFILLSLYCGQ